MLIRIKYIGPTNYRGSRIKAIPNNLDFDSQTIPYPVELEGTDAHEEALKFLCKKNDWPTEGWVGDRLSDNEYVYIQSFDPYTRYEVLLPAGIRGCRSARDFAERKHDNAKQNLV